ncbi:MAG TPA: hypothetical protein PL045_07545 [Chitinophagaceae bacterium]|nr:hypothetical protein [Chitinophagaceae bacterium]
MRILSAIIIIVFISSCRYGFSVVQNANVCIQNCTSSVCLPEIDSAPASQSADHAAGTGAGYEESPSAIWDAKMMLL